MTLTNIPFEQALDLTLSRLAPLRAVRLPVWEAGGHVLAKDALAAVDCPSVTAATKDGYAVRAADVAEASEGSPARLRLLAGLVTAGGRAGARVEPGTAVGVTTGAPLPEGADAVVPTELTDEAGGEVRVRRHAEPGRNLLRKGADVARGAVVAAAGEPLRPAATGLLAAAGLAEVEVVPRPRVALVGTGDEVVAPGRPLALGQLYASNLVTLRAWLRGFGLDGPHAVVPDDPAALRRLLEELRGEADLVLTSGGAWGSERDFSPRVVEEMGGEVVYHRVRLAPGKAAALGLLDGLVVMCLPGGPPSNEMAFLQLALPAALRLAGLPPDPFPRRRARLVAPLFKRHGDPTWTAFYQASLARCDGLLEAAPLRLPSRLACLARAEALAEVPAGVLGLEPGAEVSVQVLDPRALASA